MDVVETFPPEGNLAAHTAIRSPGGFTATASPQQLRSLGVPQCRCDRMLRFSPLSQEEQAAQEENHLMEEKKKKKQDEKKKKDAAQKKAAEQKTKVPESAKPSPSPPHPADPSVTPSVPAVNSSGNGKRAPSSVQQQQQQQQPAAPRYPPREVPPRFRQHEHKQLLKRGQPLPAGTLSLSSGVHSPPGVPQTTSSKRQTGQNHLRQRFCPFTPLKLPLYTSA
ncbi:trinucleotide repeat-containing gene 6C protein isoform X1 [Arapaima gigas]